MYMGLQEDLDLLPDHPGVYRMIDQHEKVLYIGKAKSLKKRVRSYFIGTTHSPRITLMIKQIYRIETTETQTEKEALILENLLIKTLKPKYNILFRDDKSYPYLRLTDHSFPMLDIYRGQRKSSDIYFGPYPNRTVITEAYNLIQNVFLLRTCEDSVFNHRSRPCLLHQIKRCSAPCVDYISQEEYAKSVQAAVDFLHGKKVHVLNQMEEHMLCASKNLAFEEAGMWRDRIAALRQAQMPQDIESENSSLMCDVIVLRKSQGISCIQWMTIRHGQWQGDQSILIDDDMDLADDELLEYFILQHYEKVTPPEALYLSPTPKDSNLIDALELIHQRKIKIYKRAQSTIRAWVDMGERNANQSIQKKIAQTQSQQHRIEQLEYLLHTQSIKHIECIDISHTQGQDTIASCVVYQHYMMQPHMYRRYTMRTEHGGNDYSAMQETIQRRIQSREHQPLPDIMLIDGGLGQIHAVEDILKNHPEISMTLVGVAKGAARKAGEETLILASRNHQAIHLDPNHPALHLIQTIRDEAHRFAITGHRKKRLSTSLRSSLEDIPGIGPKRKKQLLHHFGGLRGIQNASVQELMQVQGIYEQLAQNIYDSIHGKS
jgi:excinuclease ABC subunit C